MERELDQKMNMIMSKPGVVGVTCVDKRGLCLSAKGVANAEMSGVLCSIADQARKLDPTSTATPIIRLESNEGYCLVQKKGDFALGIFKTHNYSNKSTLCSKN